MPRPSPRLDLLLVPARPEELWRPSRVEGLLRRWQARGWLLGEGLRRAPGPEVDALLPGGFQVLWLDQPGAEVLYANQQGGFQVLCPRCGASRVAEFQRALPARRRGEDSRLDCPCGFSGGVTELLFRPDAAFARVALVFADARSLEPTAAARGELEQVLGTTRAVLRRRAG